MFLYIMLTTLSIHNSQEDPIQILNLYRYIDIIYIYMYITILSSEFSVKGNIELEME